MEAVHELAEIVGHGQRQIAQLQATKITGDTE
jgi:hypothetical protein